MSSLLLEVDLSFFNRVYMGEKVTNYIWCIGIVAATMLLKGPVAALLTRISSSLSARINYKEHKGTIREMLFKPIERLLQTILYFVAVNQLDSLLDRIAIRHSMGSNGKINIRLGDIVDHVFYLLFILFFTKVITSFVDFIYYLRMDKARVEKNYSRIQLFPLIKEMTKLGLWTLSAFWIMGSIFHVNVPALITGLGIGGVAIALAGKETVENFFAAFTILSDKPFQTGDIIKLGDTEGTVERIGFRSTRLRNADGSAYIIPNQNLVSQNLVNLSACSSRRVKVFANIKYGLNHEALAKLIEMIKDAVRTVPHIEEPVEVNIETFDKETFQLAISYQLPHPLPDDASLVTLKRDVNMKIFEITTANATLGTPIGTS